MSNWFSILKSEDIVEAINGARPCTTFEQLERYILINQKAMPDKGMIGITRFPLLLLMRKHLKGELVDAEDYIEFLKKHGVVKDKITGQTARVVKTLMDGTFDKELQENNWKKLIRLGLTHKNIANSYGVKAREETRREFDE